MSAIYIPGVEMQQEGDTFIAIFPDGSFKWMDKDFNIHRGVEKATPVPDHGRLGDLDKLESGLRLMAKYQSGDRQQGILGCCETIRLAHTIIPADKGA